MLRYYTQTDSQWNGYTIPGTHLTLYDCGCLLVCLTNIYNSHNPDKAMTPPDFCQRLYNYNGINSDGLVVWDGLADMLACQVRTHADFNNDSKFYIGHYNNHFVNILKSNDKLIYCFNVYGGFLELKKLTDFDRFISIWW